MRKILLFCSCVSLATLWACDPCADVDCVNGYCDEGECQCADGFQGERCEEAIPARFFSISRIQVLNFPILNKAGRAWDGGGIYPGSGPADLFAIFFSGSELMGQTNVITDGSRGANLYFNDRFWARVDERGQVSLLDWDGPSAFEVMGSYTFRPHDYAQSKPPVIELYNSASSHQVRLSVYLEWKQ